MKAYYLLMYLNDLINTQVYFDRDLAGRMTKYLTDVFDILNTSNIKNYLKRYIFLTNKKKIYIPYFKSNDNLSWFICDIIAYLKIYLPINDKTILQEIEDKCIFDKLTDEEIFKISNELDKIIDKL